MVEGVILFPDGYDGKKNGLFFDYQDGVALWEERQKLRIMNQELLRLLRNLR